MDMIRCDDPEYLIWKWRPAGAEGAETRKENAIRRRQIAYAIAKALE